MLSANRPTPTALLPFIQRQSTLPFSYSEIGQSLGDALVPGFDNDFNVTALGRGEAVFAAAKAGIRQWKMFPTAWAFITPADAPIAVGTTVAMCAQVFGLWWHNATRIVYVVDEPHRFGFAYGTLPGHVECGEERFLVEMDADGLVRYHIRAFSRPRLWAARWTYPLARTFQRRFVRDSQAALQRFVAQELSQHGTTSTTLHTTRLP